MTILLPIGCLKTVGGKANSADLDQMPHSEASDLGLHCLLMPIGTNTLVVKSTVRILW